MSWISYTEDISDDAFVHDSDHVRQLLRVSEQDLDSVKCIMIEFRDSSFLRLERSGI